MFARRVWNCKMGKCLSNWICNAFQYTQCVSANTFLDPIVREVRQLCEEIPSPTNRNCQTVNCDWWSFGIAFPIASPNSIVLGWLTYTKVKFDFITRGTFCIVNVYDKHFNCNLCTCYRVGRCDIAGSYSKIHFYRPECVLYPQTFAEIHYSVIQYCDWCLCPWWKIAAITFRQYRVANRMMVKFYTKFISKCR